MSANAVPISEREMLQARIQALHAGAAYALLANLAAVVTFVGLLSRSTDEIVWAAFMSSAIAARFLLHRAYAHDQSLGLNSYWRWLVSISAAGIAVGWCWFGLQLFATLDTGYHAALMLLVLVFVTTPAMAPFKGNSALFLGLTSAPIIVQLFLRGDPAGPLITGIFLVLLAVQWGMLEMLLGEITKNVRLRRQQEWAHIERMEHMRGVETANRLLAQALNERELVEAQLKDAMRIAEKANQAKGDFLAYTSHEIRTPLNAIIGFTRAVLATPLSDQQSDYLRRVKKAGERLLSLINDLLDMSKIEAGKLDITEQTLSLRDVVQEVSQEQLVAAREKGITISVVLTPQVPPFLIGDPLRVGQILRNLISNAVKFTTHGEVAVSVDLKERVGDTVCVYFSVRDSGIGIPLEQQSTLFQPYRQTTNTRSKGYAGTGLGLAISKSLCELMSGTIGLRSELHKGSEFFFELPFKIPASNAATTLQRSNDVKKPQRQLRVLVAEDNEDNQVLIELLLRRWGAEATIVQNGQLAVREAATGLFDVALMDLEMPVMDGFQAVSAIRSDEAERGGHLYIIALSAHALVEYREKCLAAGMDDYLTKPVEEESLYAVLGNVSELQTQVDMRPLTAQ